MYTLIVQIQKDSKIKKTKLGYWTKVAIFLPENTTGVVRNPEAFGWTHLPKLYKGGTSITIQAESLRTEEVSWYNAKVGKSVVSTHIHLNNPTFPKPTRAPRTTKKRAEVVEG